MAIRKINPESLYDGSPFGMSQATMDTESGLIFVSGQLDWDRNCVTRNPDIEKQTENAMENLKAVLEEGDSSLENILQLRVYIRGELADNMDKVVPIIARYVGNIRPALTGIGVASLASHDALIEIEAIAKTG